MIRTLRLLAAAVCIFLGTLPTYQLYQSTWNETYFNPVFYGELLAAAFICFGVFTALHLTELPRAYCALLGCLGSYLALICVMLLVSLALGQYNETMMWSPIIILFGIPFFAPIVLLSYLGSLIAFGLRSPGGSPILP